MKITKHLRFLSLILTMMMVFSTAAVFADSESPVDPTISLDKTTASAKAGGTVTLTATVTPEGAEVTWGSDNTAVATVTGSGNTATVKAVKAGTAHITATLTSGESANCTVTVTAATAAFTKAKPVVKFKKIYGSDDLEGKKDNGYTMKWTQSDKSGVDAYQILCDGKVIAKVSKSTSKYTLLAKNGTHKYAVRAVKFKADGKTVAKSVTSAAKSIKISGVLTKTDGIKWYCKTKRKATLYKKGSGGAKAGSVAKGTKLYAVGRYPAKVKKFHYASRVQVAKKPNGKPIGWLKWSDLSGGVKGNIIVKKDYTRSLKEQFVNETWNKKHKGKATPINPATNSRIKKAGSDNVLLWACLHTQRVYTFKKSGGKWVLKRTDRITTGKYSQPTRSSEKAKTIFTISKKNPGKVWMVQENGQRYYFTHQAVVTASGVSFHTGTWWESGRTRGAVVKSGKPGTYGCIRMYTGPAITLFNTVHVNKTAVLITMED